MIDMHEAFAVEACNLARNLLDDVMESCAIECHC